MHRVLGAVASAVGARLSVEEILVPDPGPGEALVRVLACGVCHSDLALRDGDIPVQFPLLLGHEAAGIVMALGDSNDDRVLAVGDHVVLAWRAPCGECRFCRRDRSRYCCATRTAQQQPTLGDGTPLQAAAGVGGFAELALVDASQAVRVDARARPDAAALVACAVSTGWGAAVHTAGVARGDTVAVFGCGGVGDAAIAGAVMAGARQVIGVDIHARRLAWAMEFGATSIVDASRVEPVEAIRSLTAGHGVDVAIEAVGRAETAAQALAVRDRAGTMVQVGVPNATDRLDLSLLELFDSGGSIKLSWYGDCLPQRDFPLLVDLYLAGRLPLDRFVTETIPLNDVEGAFTRMQHGQVLRSVVVFSER